MSTAPSVRRRTPRKSTQRVPGWSPRVRATSGRFFVCQHGLRLRWGWARPPIARRTRPGRSRAMPGRSSRASRPWRRSVPESHLIVRTGWLYGPGKGFVDWARGRLLRGEDLPLVGDQTGSPTSARELASAMLLLVEQGHRGLFHFVNQGEATWLALGRAIAEDCALSPRGIRAIQAEELNLPAARPRYSALSVEKFERTTGRTVTGWREALRQYLG